MGALAVVDLKGMGSSRFRAGRLHGHDKLSEEQLRLDSFHSFDARKTNSIVQSTHKCCEL